MILVQATGTKNLAASTLIDVLYAGRLYRVSGLRDCRCESACGKQSMNIEVLEEEGRDNEGKLREIELLLDFTKERKDMLGSMGYSICFHVLCAAFCASIFCCGGTERLCRREQLEPRSYRNL